MGEQPRVLVIPAAGLGTRMRSVAAHLPKELLPVGSKPAIQYALEEGIDAGIEDFVVVISRKKEVLKERLSGFAEFITFVYQNEPSGESDAIGLAEPIVGNHPLAVIYPDNLYLPAPGALRPLVNAFKQHNTDLVALSAVGEANAPGVGNAGRVDVARRSDGLYRLMRFLPKGPGRFKPRFKKELRSCGIMVCGAHLFEAIRRTRGTVTEGEFTDEPVRRLLLKERGLLGLKLPGQVFDIGNPEGYARCRQQLSAGS